MERNEPRLRSSSGSVSGFVLFLVVFVVPDIFVCDIVCANVRMEKSGDKE